MGQTTADMAAANSDRDYLGVEVHTPGVGSLLKLIGEQSLTNIRIIQHDAIEVLEHMIQDASLSGVQVFFPDPWPKKRHHKRRLVQPALVRLISQKMVPGGYLHCATDWEDYAIQMLEVLSSEKALENTAEDYVERPRLAASDQVRAEGNSAGPWRQGSSVQTPPELKNRPQMDVNCSMF